MCWKVLSGWLGHAWIAFVAAAIAASCSDAEPPLGEMGSVAGGGSTSVDSLDAAPTPDAAAPTLTELVATLFVPTCVLGRCHITQAPAGELSFTGRRITQHAALVNAPSSEVPRRMRVVPFDPEASYLIEKLTVNPPSAGSSMPPQGSLQPEAISRVRRWILAGALDN